MARHRLRPGWRHYRDTRWIYHQRESALQIAAGAAAKLLRVCLLGLFTGRIADIAATLAVDFLAGWCCILVQRVGRIAIRRLCFSGEANYAFGALNPEWRITIRPTNLQLPPALVIEV
jgi:hypothetical protein